MIPNSSTIIARIVTIGDSGVGKTCLLNSLVGQSFHPEEISTVGSNYRIRVEQIGNIKVKIQLWDTAGQEKFRALGKIYFRNAIGAIAVYDQTLKTSFEHLDSWINEFKDVAEPTGLIAIVGNKSDLKEAIKVPPEEAEIWAKARGYLYMQASAKTGEGIEEIITELAHKILNTTLNNFVEDAPIDEPVQQKNQCGC